MENITVSEILEATGGTLLCGDKATQIFDLCINSKEAKEGDLFIPIIGERVDAHKFIENALEKASATLTMEHKEKNDEKPWIYVEDTHKALQNIGTYYRKKMNAKVIAVTGSVGKTTTREMITTVLSAKYQTFSTKGNQNSQIGVPLTLAAMTKEDEMAVLELGMSEPGQIHTLTTMVKPNIAVVTCIGVAHIEQMKTQENIRKEKLSIIDGFDNDGIIFLNGDDNLLSTQKGILPCKTFTYGTSSECDYYATNIEMKEGCTYYDFHYDKKVEQIKLNVLGIHNVLNSVVALAIAYQENIPIEEAKKTFLEFSGLRQKIYYEKPYTVIDDTYNASPDSMKASLGVLSDLPGESRKIAVLADMLELGENTNQFHEEVGAFVGEKKVDILVTIGPLSKWIEQGAKTKNPNLEVFHFEDYIEATNWLKKELKEKDTVLLKGSNGMRLNEIVKELLQ